MGEEPRSQWSDAKLVEDANRGLSGQGAVVEMMRRLKDSNSCLIKVNLALTGIAAVATVAGVLVALLHC